MPGKQEKSGLWTHLKFVNHEGHEGTRRKTTRIYFVDSEGSMGEKSSQTLDSGQ
jgi:hypothetical protein